MHLNYQEAVEFFYHEKLKQGDLPGLTEPTPANILSACDLKLKQGVERKDLPMLFAFFKVGKEEDLLRAISKFDRDRLKPIVKFLRKQSNTTNILNIELLAWLSDFPERPNQGKIFYEPIYPPKTGGKKSESIENSDKGNEVELPPMQAAFSNQEEKEESGRKRPLLLSLLRPRRKSIATGLLFATIGSGAFFTHQAIVGGKKTASGQCMYWTGTKYELTSCEPKGGDTLVIAADYDKLEKFELITRKDTLTRWAIGRVWYLKRNNQVECFTARGTHPLYPEKMLKKLSTYMYDKYIQPNTGNSIAGELSN